MRLTRLAGSKVLRNALLPGSITLFSLTSLPGYSASVGLVSNINTTVIPQSSFPQSLGFLNGKMLFGASDSTSPGLSSTDGTANGTQLIQRFSTQGQLATGSGAFLIAGNGAYFAAEDPSGTSMIWFTDGSIQDTR